MNMESQIQNINVDLIIPNRFQPRLTFDENALNELAKSIKEHGIIQPLVLRRVNDKYEIIAGERRYKAAVLAGLSEVPAIISNYDDNESAEVAIVENVQRKNLNSMEEAKSYKKLLDKGYLTQESLAKKMGISQSTLANKLRLLNLSTEVQNALLNNQISERHARSLLLVDDKARQVSLLNRVIAERLTVRQLDEIIKNSSDFNGGKIIDKKNAEDQPTPINAVSNKQSAVNLVNESQNSLNSALESTNIFDRPFTEFPVDVQTEVSKEKDDTSSHEEIETFDTLDLNNENSEEINPTSDSSNLFDIFKTPNYTSLEDEVTNMNVDNEEYFNPFNNIQNEIPEETPITHNLEEEKNVVTDDKKIKPGDFSSIKEAYENLQKEIEQAGFKVVSEDFDFEDIYQIIIKIDKQA